MSLKIGTKQVTDLPVGRYPSILVSMKATTTRFGPALIVEFEVTSEEHEGEHVDGIFPRDITLKNKLGRLVKNTGREPEEIQEVEVDDLYNSPIGIIVNQKQGKVNTFASVVDTYSLG